MSKRLLHFFLSITCLLSACASTPSQERRKSTTPREVAKLSPRAKLPLHVREALASRMDRHGEQMTVLLSSVVLLDYELTQEVAQEIADEPTLGRPSPSETDTLNALLPSKFFDYQDQLAERARVLARAGAARSNAQLSRAFSALTETCVACHSVYLQEDVEVADDPEGDDVEDLDFEGHDVEPEVEDHPQETHEL